jgi:dUTP pyrophosphatase
MARKFLIKVLNCENEDYYTNHSTYHKGDSGLDLFVVEDQMIPGGETKMVKLGITCQSRKFTWCLRKWIKNRSFYQYYSYYLFPRSSISKTPLILHNSIGLIDAGYTGEIMAAMRNLSSEPFLIKKGERYVQLVNSDLSSVNFELVDDLRKTTRGSGGFGSTGVSQTSPKVSVFTKQFKKVTFSPSLSDIKEENNNCCENDNCCDNETNCDNDCQPECHCSDPIENGPIQKLYSLNSLEELHK